MTKDLFPPGPWQVHDIEPGCDIDIISEPFGTNLAVVLGTDNFPCLDEQDAAAVQPEIEAAAHLIAAAPDLLAACEAFVEAWERSLQLEKTDVALRLAKQAIEKARGEA